MAHSARLWLVTWIYLARDRSIAFHRDRAHNNHIIYNPIYIQWNGACSAVYYKQPLNHSIRERRKHSKAIFTHSLTDRLADWLTG